MNDLHISDAKHIAGIVPFDSIEQGDVLKGGYGSVTAKYSRENNIRFLESTATSDNYNLSVYVTNNENVYVMHPNNMVTVAANRPTHDATLLAPYLPFKELEQNRQGIYLVETFKIHSVFGDGTDDLLEYYLTTRDIEYSHDVLEDIKTTIRHSVGKRGRLNEVKLRIVTYVPYTELLEEDYVYVPGPNVILVNRSIPKELVHIYSHANLESKINDIIDSDDSTVTVGVTIVDNDHQVHYMRLGNEIVKIPSIKSNELDNYLPEGCSITVKRNGNVIDEKFIELKEFRNAGIYRNKQLCEHDIDKEEKLEVLRNEVEINKAYASVEKVKLEKEFKEKEHQHKLDMIDVDKSKKVFDMKLYAKQKEFDFQIGALEKEYAAYESGFNTTATIYSKLIDTQLRTKEHHIRMQEKMNEAKLNRGIKLIDLAIGSSLKFIR